MRLVLDQNLEPLPTFAVKRAPAAHHRTFTTLVAELFLPRTLSTSTTTALGAYPLQRPPQRELPVIFDSGASCSLSPIRSDFVGELQPPDVGEMKGIGASIKTVGKGTVEWPIVDLRGCTRILRTTAHHVPGAHVRIFSPQSYFQENGNKGKAIFTADRALLTTPTGFELEFPYNAFSNLPLMLLNNDFESCSVTASDLRDISSHFQTLAAFPSVASQTNQNLSAAQKELLLWHWKLCHVSFDHV